MTKEAKNYWELIDYNLNHVQNSEIKASFILTIYGIIVGFSQQIQFDFSNIGNFIYIVYFLGSFFVLFSLAAIYFCFKVYKPRINQKLKKSVFFFFDIRDYYKTADIYRKELKEVMEDSEVLKDLLSEQAYINGIIAADKYTNVLKSIQYFIYSIISLLAILIFELIILQII